MSYSQDQLKEINAIQDRVRRLRDEGRIEDATALHKEYWPELWPPSNSDFSI